MSAPLSITWGEMKILDEPLNDTVYDRIKYVGQHYGLSFARMKLFETENLTRRKSEKKSLAMRNRTVKRPTNATITEMILIRVLIDLKSW